jgi:hypothetical protein
VTHNEANFFAVHLANSMFVMSLKSKCTANILAHGKLTFPGSGDQMVVAKFVSSRSICVLL